MTAQLASGTNLRFSVRIEASMTSAGSPPRLRRALLAGGFVLLAAILGSLMVLALARFSSPASQRVRLEIGQCRDELDAVRRSPVSGERGGVSLDFKCT
jgi:type II secretory pathway component PulM